MKLRVLAATPQGLKVVRKRLRFDCYPDSDKEAFEPSILLSVTWYFPDVTPP